MGNGNVLFESIFNRKISDSGTRDYLAGVSRDHPYFIPAHFFLLLQTEQDAKEYNQLAAKTAILFNNAYWLQFQLQEKSALPGDEATPSILPENSAFAQQPEAVKASITTVEPQQIGGTEIATTIYPEAEETDTVANDIEKTVPDFEEEETSAGILPGLVATAPQQESHLSPSTDQNTISMEEMIPEPTNEKDITEIQSDLPPSATANEEAVLAMMPEKNVEETISDITPKEKEMVNTLPSLHFNNDAVPLINETGAEEQEYPETESAPLHFKLNIDTSNVTEDRLSFEPLHTSDYFASQGIKLSSEIKGTDKLGKQLKSFTEWLKTMKKIQGDQLPPSNGLAELSVQKLAEQSNKEGEVVTEAMAEVLLQQGKTGKALDVYKKLSLLNPSKSTYFAAKIDQLKEH